MPHRISAIVPTIGRAESLSTLLAALAAQTRRPDEVVVADGSVTQAVRAIADDPRWPAAGLAVRYVHVLPPHAVRQRQAAIAESSGSLLLLLDDDVVPEPACVAAMVAAVERPDVVAVTADFNNQAWPGPTVLWRWVLRYIYGLADGAWQGQVIGPLLRFGYRPSPPNIAPMQWLGSGNSLVRRDAYERAGGFSEFFLHRSTINEDVDLGIKLARLGRIVLAPAARMAHLQAPGGRVSPRIAAEDDLYNRYVILRSTVGRSAPAAFALVSGFCAVETIGNLGGVVLRSHGAGFVDRLTGRLQALARIAVPIPRLRHNWAVIRRHPRPWRFVSARLLMATGLCRLCTIAMPGFSVRFHPANLPSQLWIDPHGRDQALAFFSDYVKSGDVVVDVGANIGDTVLAASARAGSSGRVFGLEPHPRTFRFLADNVALNRVTNVELLNVAAGAAAGHARFSDDRRDDMNRIDGGSLEVPVTRLDDVIHGASPIALLKADVEGYEKYVFEGAPATLARTRVVHFEVSSRHFARFGYNTADLLTLISAAGFALFRISGPREISAVSVTFDTERFENLLAIRDVGDFLQRTGWSQAAAR